MKTKLLTITTMVVLLLTAMTKGLGQNTATPCLPQMHALQVHQSALCGVTQSIALTLGWNWMSIYVEGDPIEMLQALEAGLEDNAVEIQSSDMTTEYDGEWWGELDDVGITSDQMYMINVVTPCEVELEGLPVAGCEITINPGWNWIGFPSAVAMDVADALAEFEAEMEDMLQGGEIQTEYDGEWWGELETLEPGQGYMYYSSSTVPKTLVFGTSAKARRSGSSKGVLKSQLKKDIKPVGKKNDRE